MNIDAELTQYVETALWSSHDESTPDGGEPMDANYDADDIAPEALESMRKDVDAFMNDAELRNALNFWYSALGEGQAGQDFWLTRNGHGAGFRDRFSAGMGERYGRLLTDASKPYGHSNLYVGDDGRVYVS